MRTRVLLATCADLPAGDDEDGALLLDACHRHDVDAAWAVWDSPEVDWEDASMSVIRSTWDYTARRAEFLAWAESVSRLANPAAVVAWNCDKRYLAQLERAGVPIVPTTWAAHGEQPQWPEGVEFVVKPTVGAGSLGAGRFRVGDLDVAHQHLGTLHAAGRVAMIQPYLDGVDEAGETGLIFVDGAFSHAIRKAPMLDPGTVHGVRNTSSRALFAAERITRRKPGEDELALANTVLDTAHDLLGLTGPLLYARVDLLPSAHGPVLIELELIEPSLFLSQNPPAADRLAAAIHQRTSHVPASHR